MKTPLPAARQIPPERKALYYGGMAASIVGLLLFLSTFVTFAAHFGDFSNFESNAKSDMFRAIGGMALIMVGGAIMNVAARGFAGSGLMLDPEKARRDLEPWARMSGGLTNDALSEVEPVQRIVEHITSGEQLVEVVKVRCGKCRALNEESDRFCGQCGAAL